MIIYNNKIGALMGLATGNGSYELYRGIFVAPYTILSPAPVEWAVPLYSLLFGMAIGLAGGPAGVKTFGEERMVFFREAASGHGHLSYFLGKVSFYLLKNMFLLLFIIVFIILLLIIDCVVYLSDVQTSVECPPLCNDLPHHGSPSHILCLHLLCCLPLLLLCLWIGSCGKHVGEERECFFVGSGHLFVRCCLQWIWPQS